MQLKKIFLTRLPIVLCCMISMSCSNERIKPAGLYNIDSLIVTQIDYLIAHKATMRKETTLNGIEKISTTIPKNAMDWKNELAIFSELDVINKPINKGAYTIENHADIKSNLQVQAFNTTADLPVKYLRVYYQHSLNKIRKIEAQYNEANTLYTSARFLAMEFEDSFDKTILTSYSIKGGQKMFLDDTVRYTIDVSINLKN